jgi:hypothetical protein
VFDFHKIASMPGKWIGGFHLTGMKPKYPTAGRPRKVKTVVMEVLGDYIAVTALGGLFWLWFGGGKPALVMLAVSGLLWWLCSLVDLFWP